MPANQKKKKNEERQGVLSVSYVKPLRPYMIVYAVLNCNMIACWKSMT